MKKRRFVILDRDGTIIVERNYLSDPDQVELIPGAAEGLAQLSILGLGLVVVSNQSGIGRGFFDESRLSQIHQRMCQLLAEHGVWLSGIYYCPHTPDDHCDCRKPHPGLVERAARELDFDPSEAFVIGDKPCDIELGQRIGAATLLVRSGYGAAVEAAGTAEPDCIVNTIHDAACVIAELVRRHRQRVAAAAVTQETPQGTAL
jgi:D-glycero-D-manno-heptose 1,7-bisphosphate phosphatase